MAWGRRRRRKQMIRNITITVIVLLVIMAGVFFFIYRGKDSGPDKGAENKKETIDTTLTGSADVDPENMELSAEEGAGVKAGDLVRDGKSTNGIDVSKWQGKIDWKKVKASGIDFAFIRIGYRGEDGVIYKDDNADYNLQKAGEAGVKTGVYFFSTAVNEKEAVEEANWTKKAIAGYGISYPVVYDCEGFHSENSRMKEVTAEERTENALAYLRNIKKAGYEPMFYSSLRDAQGLSAWDIKKIEKDYKIWIAQYAEETFPEKTEPDYRGRVDAWQYTNRGQVDGVPGNVDMVVCYFDMDEAEAKDKSARPKDAKAPLTDEEKLYKSVNETVTAKQVTNLRKGPSVKTDRVGELKNGETLKRTGIGKNGWSKLEYNGQTVYAISSYLTEDLDAKPPTPSKADVVDGNTFTAKKDRVTAKDHVNLRSMPNTDSEIVGTLQSGEFTERTAVSDKGWSRLNYNGKVVYAVSSYLSNDIVKQEDPQPQKPSDGFEPVDEKVTAKSETNLRTAPSTDGSEVVYKLTNGEFVRRVGIHSNGWSKLEYNGQTVYAISSYLTK